MLKTDAVDKGPTEEERKEFHQILAKLRQTYKGGWLYGFRPETLSETNCGSKRLLDYAVVEDVNEIKDLVPDGLIAYFGKPRPIFQEVATFKH